MNSSRDKLIKSIEILKNSLYDENGNLREPNFFSGGLAERENKINTLNNYSTLLEEIDKNNRFLLENEKHIQDKRNKSYKIPLAHKGIKKQINGIYSCIQNAEGNYEDAIVLYKGYSSEYKVEFIVYIKEKTKEVVAAPIISFDGNFITKSTNNKQMVMAFQMQYMNQVDSFNDLESIPSVISCIDAPQNQNINKFDKEETNQLKNTFSYTISNDNRMYYYKARLPWYNDTENCTRKLFKYLKEKPGLRANIEYMNNINGEPEIILAFSVPMQELEVYNQSEFQSREDKLAFLSKYIGDQVDENYLNNKFKPEFNFEDFDTRDRLMFITDLDKSNPNAHIQGREEKEKYRIYSEIPLSELITESTWPFFVDKEGYIIKTSQKLAKYSFDFIRRDLHDIDSIEPSETNIDDDPFFVKKSIPNYIDKYIVHKDKNTTEQNIPSNSVQNENEKIRILLEQNKQLMEQNRLLDEQNKMLLAQINSIKEQNKILLEQIGQIQSIILTTNIQNNPVIK